MIVLLYFLCHLQKRPICLRNYNFLCPSLVTSCNSWGRSFPSEDTLWSDPHKNSQALNLWSPDTTLASSSQQTHTALLPAAFTGEPVSTAAQRTAITFTQHTLPFASSQPHGSPEVKGGRETPCHHPFSSLSRHSPFILHFSSLTRITNQHLLRGSKSLSAKL